MQAPRRLQLRRGNTAAVSTYVGAPGELIINTDTNTLYVHNGVTVGGIASTVNTSAITSNISSLQSSVAVLQGNILTLESGITTLTSNAAVQAGVLATLLANAGAQSGDITTLLSNASVQSGDLATLTSNAATQAGLLATLTSNAASQSGTLADLIANAAVQAGLIASVTGTYSNANVKTYLSNFDGNLIPSANVTYSLGSITNQWKDLFVSNNTIYIGGVPLSIDSGGNLLVNGNVVQGATTGNITLPAGGIITAPNAQEFQLQAKDTNSLLRNEINLDPNNGTYMSVWSEELSTSFSTSDWATGSWVNESGFGAAYFTNAEDLQDFWTIGVGSFVNSVEVSINDGARIPVSYDGNNGETYGVLLLVTGVPATSPTTITSLTFYYRTQSSIDIDYNDGEILLDAQAMDLDLRTTNYLDLRAGQNLTLRGTGQYPVRIYTDDITHKWEFDTTGSLTLPREGKIYGVGDGVAAGDRLGYISWTGNSSGDGSGLNTMRLVPDQQGLEDLDQYIILDPTFNEPGIHIRAGGTQGNSQANLYLGGANSHVKIGSGLNPPVTVLANNNSWTFGTNGNVIFPDSTVQITAFSNAAISTYLVAETAKTIHGNVSIQGNLTVNGNVTYINVLNYTVGDNIINFADGNPADTLDLGFAAHRTVGGTLEHTGLVRDSSDNTWRLFSNVDTSPGTTVDFTNAIYDAIRVGNITSPTIDTLTANLGGVAGSLATLTANAGAQAGSLATITANLGSVSGSLVTLTSNAAVQAGDIATLYANAGAQAGTLATITANLGAVSGSLATLTANASGSTYSNTNVAAYLTTATITTTGNITAGNLTTGGALYVANITTTGSSGNISGANYITANVILTNGGWGNISQVANIQANAVLVSGNVSAQYFLGNGALLTGIVSGGGTNYSNANVATYLTNYDGDINFTSSVAIISNVDVITVLDHIRSPSYQYSNGVSILSGLGYGNTEVASYLPTYTGNLAAANLLMSSRTVNSTSTTVDLFNDTTLNINAFGAATDINIGVNNAAARFGIKTPNIWFDNLANLATYSSNINVFNTTATGVNAFGAANTIVFGANTSSTTFRGNVTAANFIGNISITGNVTGTSSNVTLQAGAYTSVFDNQGNVTVPQLFTAGNIQTTSYFLGNGALLTGVVSKTTGSWTVTTGTNTYSIQLAENGTYQLWVIGNIPNGIISYNATATITNSNVPVVGAQYAWVYNGGGTPIDFTSIPNQFTGTGNTIVRSTGGPSTTTNRFDFGINNTSGGNVTVSYGYVKIS